MKVKNIPKTSDKSCNCNNWYIHWKKSSKYEKVRCSNINCPNDNPVGAHVKKYNSTDKKHYIVPLCKACNNPNNIKIMDIGTSHLARAIKLLTCG